MRLVQPMILSSRKAELYLVNTTKCVQPDHIEPWRQQLQY